MSLDTKQISYIHGGAWRDPKQTSRTLVPTLSNLSPSSYPIAGIISANYRLSAYPGHATDPSKPEDKSRNATHPEHIQDILTAIRFFQDKYRFGEDYILAGHSCGATLVYQVAMGSWKARKREDQDDNTPIEDSLKLPKAVVGIEGIYDLELLKKTHPDMLIYKTFLETAFGTDQSKWKDASPVNGKLHDKWPSGKVAVLAQSKEDELVDWIQTEKMSDALWREKKTGRRDIVVGLEGKHEDVWRHGKGVAKAITKALEMLRDA